MSIVEFKMGLNGMFSLLIAALFIYFTTNLYFWYNYDDGFSRNMGQVYYRIGFPLAASKLTFLYHFDTITRMDIVNFRRAGTEDMFKFLMTAFFIFHNLFVIFSRNRGQIY